MCVHRISMMRRMAISIMCPSICAVIIVCLCVATLIGPVRTTRPLGCGSLTSSGAVTTGPATSSSPAAPSVLPVLCPTATASSTKEKYQIRYKKNYIIKLKNVPDHNIFTQRQDSNLQLIIKSVHLPY